MTPDELMIKASRLDENLGTRSWKKKGLIKRNIMVTSEAQRKQNEKKHQQLDTRYQDVLKCSSPGPSTPETPPAPSPAKVVVIVCQNNPPPLQIEADASESLPPLWDIWRLRESVPDPPRLRDECGPMEFELVKPSKTSEDKVG
jgi:hypothetical protein